MVLAATGLPGHRLISQPRLLVRFCQARSGPGGNHPGLAGPLPYCELLQRPLAEDAD
jgi:hypothetical protein